MESAAPLEPEQVARALRVDAMTATVASELDAAGVRYLLVKGAATARLLYDHPAQRGPSDIDLLVDPARIDDAVAILLAAGFWNRDAGREVLRSRSLARTSDGLPLELHEVLHGVLTPPGRAWAELWRRRIAIGVGSRDVPSLDPVAALVSIALNAARHQPDDGKRQEDLRRAAARFKQTDWEAAAELAARLRATASFAAGLRTAPETHAVATALRLPQVGHAEAQRDFYRSLVLRSLARAIRRRDARGVLRLLFPPREKGFITDTARRARGAAAHAVRAGARNARHRRRIGR